MRVYGVIYFDTWLDASAVVVVIVRRRSPLVLRSASSWADAIRVASAFDDGLAWVVAGASMLA